MVSASVRVDISKNRARCQEQKERNPAQLDLLYVERLIYAAGEPYLSEL